MLAEKEGAWYKITVIYILIISIVVQALNPVRQMLTAVADLGFHEGGYFCQVCLCARENFYKLCPLPAKNHALLRS